MSEKRDINRMVYANLSLIESITGERPKWIHTVRLGEWYQSKWWDRAVQRANEAGCQPVLIQRTGVGLWVARTRTQLMPYEAWLKVLKSSGNKVL